MPDYIRWGLACYLKFFDVHWGLNGTRRCNLFLKVLSSEMEGSFDRSSLKEAQKVFRKIRPSPILCEPFKV
jgi:hypothetical protein